MEHVIEFPDIGFGEERRNRRSPHPMMSMVDSGEHGLGRVEVRYSPFVLIPLLSYLSTVRIIEIRIVDVDCVRGDADYWA